MPTYEYKCTSCGKTIEVFHGINASPEVCCPACSGDVQRVIGAGAGIIVKGGVAASAGRPSTRCGNATPCCGREVPCDKPPCD